jgi:hypothetical protein
VLLYELVKALIVLLILAFAMMFGIVYVTVVALGALVTAITDRVFE